MCSRVCECVLVCMCCDVIFWPLTRLLTALRSDEHYECWSRISVLSRRQCYLAVPYSSHTFFTPTHINTLVNSNATCVTSPEKYQRSSKIKRSHSEFSPTSCTSYSYYAFQSVRTFYCSHHSFERIDVDLQTIWS